MNGQDRSAEDGRNDNGLHVDGSGIELDSEHNVSRGYPVESEYKL